MAWREKSFPGECRSIRNPRVFHSQTNRIDNGVNNPFYPVIPPMPAERPQFVIVDRKYPAVLFNANDGTWGLRKKAVRAYGSVMRAAIDADEWQLSKNRFAIKSAVS